MTEQEMLQLVSAYADEIKSAGCENAQLVEQVAIALNLQIEELRDAFEGVTQIDASALAATQAQLKLLKEALDGNDELEGLQNYEALKATVASLQVTIGSLDVRIVNNATIANEAKALSLANAARLNDLIASVTQYVSQVTSFGDRISVLEAKADASGSKDCVSTEQLSVVIEKMRIGLKSSRDCWAGASQRIRSAGINVSLIINGEQVGGSADVASDVVDDMPMDDMDMADPNAPAV